MSKITPWMPEQERVRLAVLGKLIEELGEATQRAARCITHGIDEVDPDTGRRNYEELQRELTDVEACIETARGELRGIDFDAVRYESKVVGFVQWHDMIRAKTHPLAVFPDGMPLGLYRIWWKSGGTSLAAVGMLPDGRRWIAPTNWVRPGTEPTADEWGEIERYELITVEVPE